MSFNSVGCYGYLLLLLFFICIQLLNDAEEKNYLKFFCLKLFLLLSKEEKIKRKHTVKFFKNKKYSNNCH